MKLIGCIFVGNEKLMVKYAMPYIIDYGYDKLYIYDDSVDGTIDLIKEYNCPFIEIIDLHGAYGTYGNVSAFEDYRLKKETEMFEMLKKEATETGEEIWFSFMDFDEVVFGRRYINDGFKMYLWELSISSNVNYFAGKSAQLVSKYEKCEDLDLALGKQRFAHGLEGMECISWSCWGSKVSAIKVNDIKHAYFDLGNHSFKCTMEDGVSPINANDFGNFFRFHLKFLTKEIYMYKQKFYEERFGIYSKNETFDETYYRKISTKFPIRLIFYDDYEKYSYQSKAMGIGYIGGLTLV